MEPRNLLRSNMFSSFYQHHPDFRKEVLDEGSNKVHRVYLPRKSKDHKSVARKDKLVYSNILDKLESLKVDNDIKRNTKIGAASDDTEIRPAPSEEVLKQLRISARKFEYMVILRETALGLEDERTNSALQNLRYCYMALGYDDVIELLLSSPDVFITNLKIAVFGVEKPSPDDILEKIKEFSEADVNPRLM